MRSGGKKQANDVQDSIDAGLEIYKGEMLHGWKV